MTKDEQKIVELKYANKQIGKMTYEEISKWSLALLLKIHVITGWVIPTEKEVRNVLVDQFEKILQEKYDHLNPDEIEYAFRSRGTVVEDWGKNTNLNLIDKILIPYTNERGETSRAEEKIKQGPPPGPNFYRMLNEDYKMFCGRHKHLFRGINFFVPAQYDVLAEAGGFDKDFYLERLELYLKRWPNEQEEKLIDIAKERCVLQLFRKAKRKGIDILFT